MNITSEYFSVARGGTFSVNNTSEVTKDFYGFYISADAVIASLKVGGVDVKADYIQTAANAIPAGEIVSCFADSHFSAITLTSGNVSLVLKK